jgi:predicted Zn-dependent protease
VNVRLFALALLIVLPLAAPVAGRASDAPLSGAEGHPRARFPLALYAPPREDAALQAAVTRAVRDWNAIFEVALGLVAFTEVARAEDAAVMVAFEAALTSGAMGVTYVDTDGAGVIRLPVHVVLAEPAARGRTARDVVLYQVVAHELGHALGLPHATDPRSIMCCVDGSIDFKDARVREAYIEARRHPDLASVRGELMLHYERFWRQRGDGTPSR